jgi:hypothetical protein
MTTQSLGPVPGPRDVALSVVLPVYRTRAFLPELHRRLGAVLDQLGVDGELIFVDDACPEESWTELAGLARRDPRVRALRLAGNVGQQRAVLAGLQCARSNIVVVMDADLQDPPEAIPALLARLDAGTAGVFAARAGHYESRGRLVTSRLFKWTVTRLTGAPRGAGLFVALRRPLVSHLLAHAPARPHLVAMISCAGFPLAAVPVTREVRSVGHSAYSARQRVRAGSTAFWLLLRTRLGHPPPPGPPARVAECVDFTVPLSAPEVAR